MSVFKKLIGAALAAAVLYPTAVVAQTSSPSTRPPSGDGKCPAMDLSRVGAPSVFRYGLSGAELQKDFFDPGGLKDKGYRPTRLTGVQDGSEVEFATRWVKAAGPAWRSGFGLTGNQFHNDYLAYRDKYKPIDVSGFNTPAGIRYNIVWEHNTQGVDWRLYRDKTRDEMQDLVDQHELDGFAPERVEGYRNAQGDLRYISSWVYAPRCDWRMHNRMTGDEYQDHFDDYAAAGYRLLHVDSTRWEHSMRFHAIWWKQDGPVWQARSDQDWYLFQQFANNNLCSGFALTSFYAADNSAAGMARYGGIWTFNQPAPIDDTSPLSDQVREEVDCAPGRGGAAVINLTTGEEILSHADQVFGTSSTIKSAILYALLKKLDTEGTSPQTLLDLPQQIGSNQGPDDQPPPLQEGDDETIDYLARIMIEYSNNWATNRLIQYVGMAAVNDALDDLGLERTRLNRYMTGKDAPTAHGTTGAEGDYQAGYDNVTTPREYATFLKLMHENAGGLSPAMHDRYWEIMSLNGLENDGMLADGLPDWSADLDLFNKAGSNKWGWDDDTDPWTSDVDPGIYAHRPQLDSHVQRSEAGRMVFTNGQVAVYAVFFNDAQNLPDYTPFADAIECVKVEVAREYSGHTTGVVLPECK